MPLDKNTACYSLFTCCSETLLRQLKKEEDQSSLWKDLFIVKKKKGATWTGREEGLEESNMRTQVCMSNLCVVVLRKKFTVTAVLCYVYQGPHSMHMQTEWYYPLSDTFLQKFVLKTNTYIYILCYSAMLCIV